MIVANLPLTFCRNVRYLRMTSGRSEEDFAARLGLTLQQLHTIEACDRPVDIDADALLLLTELFHVEVERLVFHDLKNSST